VVKNAFRISCQKFQIYLKMTLQSLLENSDNIIFAISILHNYLRDQGVGLSNTASSANVQNNLKKIQNQGEGAHQNAFEVRDKFQQFFNRPSGMPWQKGSV
jgi:hypothetical protein